MFAPHGTRQGESQRWTSSSRISTVEVVAMIFLIFVAAGEQ